MAAKFKPTIAMTHKHILIHIRAVDNCVKFELDKIKAVACKTVNTHTTICNSIGSHLAQ